MRRLLAAAYFNLRAAIGFLTRIPVGRCNHAPRSGASVFFPLVGTLVGLIGAGVWHASIGFSPSVRAWLVILALLLVTGAFHEDGLADTADALGGALSRARVFEILKDSRVGTFGALALVGVVSLRAVLFTELLPKGVWALVASQTVSRLSPVLLMLELEHVTPTASRSPSVMPVTTGQSAAATLYTVLLCAALVVLGRLSLVRLAYACAALTAMTGWLGYRFQQRAGGITGDFLGATQQLCELVFLLTLAYGSP